LNDALVLVHRITKETYWWYILYYWGGIKR